MAVSIIVSGTRGMPLEAISLCMEVRYHMDVAPPCTADDLTARLKAQDVDVVVLAPPSDRFRKLLSRQPRT